MVLVVEDESEVVNVDAVVWADTPVLERVRVRERRMVLSVCSFISNSRQRPIV